MEARGNLIRRNSCTTIGQQVKDTRILEAVSLIDNKVMRIITNQQGRRIGESHPRAKLTDREAELIAWLHHDQQMSYLCLAEKFEVSKSCIAHICSGYRRGQAIGLIRDDPDAKP